MKKSSTTTAAILTIAALGMSACSGGASNNDSTGDEDVTLTFLNPHAGAYDDVVAAFEEAHTNITVKQESVPFDQMVSQTQARLGSGDTSIDVVSVDPPRLPGMVESGFLMDVSDDRGEMEKVFSDVSLSSVTWDDKLWAYPQWTSDNFLFYNIDALEAAGVDLPGKSADERLTWEEVLDAAEKTRESGETQYGFAIEQVDRYYALQPLLMSHGAEAGLDGLTPAVDTPEWKEFGEWYGSLYADGLSPRGVDPAQMADLFKSGQTAFLLAGATRIADFQDSDIKDGWGLAPHPHFDGKPVVTPTDSWAMGVSAHSEKQEAALEFVRFATATPEGAIATSSVMTLPPANTSAAENYEEFLADVAPERTSDLAALIERDSEENAVHRPRSTGYVIFETAINKAFADIRNGGDASTILDEVQQDLSRQLER